MKCYIHTEADAIGTCVRCGKFICETCKTELKGKNYCKKCVDEELQEKENKLENAENKSASNTPMVFMNAGGGGASSSSSSSSSSGGGRSGAPPYPMASTMVHILLACTTCGIGNIIYHLSIKKKQKIWNTLYR